MVPSLRFPQGAEAPWGDSGALSRRHPPGLQPVYRFSRRLPLNTTAIVPMTFSFAMSPVTTVEADCQFAKPSGEQPCEGVSEVRE